MTRYCSERDHRVRTKTFSLSDQKRIRINRLSYREVVDTENKSISQNNI